ncbi:hypothetical protein PFNF54_00460 [Plasmodium falciparum NF54]|nr:hypothetical protein PFNF54_00460 [Plasmodium falciparum NF54]
MCDKSKNNMCDDNKKEIEIVNIIHTSNARQNYNKTNEKIKNISREYMTESYGDISTPLKKNVNVNVNKDIHIINDKHERICTKNNNPNLHICQPTNDQDGDKKKNIVKFKSVENRTPHTYLLFKNDENKAYLEMVKSVNYMNKKKGAQHNITNKIDVENSSPVHVPPHNIGYKKVDYNEGENIKVSSQKQINNNNNNNNNNYNNNNNNNYNKNNYNKNNYNNNYYDYPSLYINNPVDSLNHSKGVQKKNDDTDKNNITSACENEENKKSSCLINNKTLYFIYPPKNRSSCYGKTYDYINHIKCEGGNKNKSKNNDIKRYINFTHLTKEQDITNKCVEKNRMDDIYRNDDRKYMKSLHFYNNYLNTTRGTYVAHPYYYNNMRSNNKTQCSEQKNKGIAVGREDNKKNTNSINFILDPYFFKKIK